MGIEFKNAYYIKLGAQGEWEALSIEENKIRIGWSNQLIEDINSQRWDKVRAQLGSEISDRGAVTRDFNALRKIAASTPSDIWITFYASQMWWCRVDDTGLGQDEISKYRTLSRNWSCLDTEGNKLLTNNISGNLSKIQGFRGTICNIKEPNYLCRLLSGESSEEFIAINEARNSLVKLTSDVIRMLHWSDFEALVDILFTRAGWQRISYVGKTQQFVDLEYRAPITGKLYQVQVKSSSNMQQYINYVKEFDYNRFEKLYYVVHSPDKSLSSTPYEQQGVELIFDIRLAEMSVDYGALGWLMEKIR